VPITPDLPAYLTPSEVAERLKVGRRHVYALIQKGDLHADKISHRVLRITPEALNNYINKVNSDVSI
jgi:excisionase family DNA binding protein